MANHLFLASTPFNALTASMIALSLPATDRCWLWLIDQQEGNRFPDYLQRWADSPFAGIQLISRRVRGKDKYATRQQTLTTIREQLPTIRPDRIYTGNDRRIEFQYSMHLARQSAAVSGIYVDDGSYSYIGRKTSWLFDQVFDNAIKKLAYGFWWKQPPTIGASDWIDESWLAFPDAALTALRRKPIHELPHNLDKPEFQSLAATGLPDGRIRLASAAAVILLPHSSVATGDETREMLDWLKQRKGQRPLAYKRHPRSPDSPIPGLPGNSIEIPSSLPMEILLPLLPERCLIAGTMSTALLTAAWLRPDLEVFASLNQNADPAWVKLLQRSGVTLIGSSHAA